MKSVTVKTPGKWILPLSNVTYVILCTYKLSLVKQQTQPQTLLLFIYVAVVSHTRSNGNYAEKIIGSPHWTRLACRLDTDIVKNN